MDQIRITGKARGAARCRVSGKRRNAAGGMIWLTEGRVDLPHGGVALLIRCPTSHCEARLTMQQVNPVKAARNSSNGL